MATVTASLAQTGVQPKGLRVGLVAVRSVYSADPATSSTIGTTIQMVKVPAGATVVYIQYGTSQPGDHTFSVGDGISNARYKVDSTFTAAQGMVVGTIVAQPYTYSQDDTIDIFISLVSESSLGGGWYLNVIYSMDPFG